MPCGRVIAWSNRSRLPIDMPRSESERLWAELSRIRITTFSPHTVGSEATRRSTVRPSCATVMRPSWGRRRSAMSIWDMILRREMTPSWMPRSARCISCSTPSMRYRTVRRCSPGSMWMSLARSFTAWAISRFTKRTTGASPAWPSMLSVKTGTSLAASSSSAAETSRSSSSERMKRSNARARASLATTTGSITMSVRLATSSMAMMSVGSTIPITSSSAKCSGSICSGRRGVGRREAGRTSIGISWYLRHRAPGTRAITAGSSWVSVRSWYSWLLCSATARATCASVTSRCEIRCRSSSAVSPNRVTACDIVAASTAPLSTRVWASPRISLPQGRWVALSVGADGRRGGWSGEVAVQRASPVPGGCHADMRGPRVRTDLPGTAGNPYEGVLVSYLRATPG